MSIGDYLQRIGYRERLVPEPTVLDALHRCHLRRVPFENLDIPLGRPIALDRAALFDKIVGRLRGGFCYELNGLFAWLLESVGFDVAMLSGRVFGGGERGPEFDHMALRVETAAGPFLADVGFGDSFIEPLPLRAGEERRQRDRTYRLDRDGAGWVLMRRLPDADWEPQYAFDLTPHPMVDFEARCRFQQTSPESVFTRKSLCSRLTADGRVTLSNGRLIVTAGRDRREQPIGSVAEYRGLLHRRFGIRLDDLADTALEVLLEPGGAG